MSTKAQRRRKAQDNLPGSMVNYIIDPEVVFGFTASILAARFDDPVQTPAFHLDLWDLCAQPYKRVAIAAPRGHAKSTAVTLSFTLACALFMKKRNIMVLSDTEDQAQGHLAAIRAELADNEDLVAQFNIKGFIADSKKELIVIMGDGGYQFRIFAKGAGQSLRGSRWGSLRPDLVIADDIENDEAVENDDRRLKFKRWMSAALMPMLAKHGHVRLVGTVLHFDSYLEGILKSNYWKSYRYEAHDDNFKNILWPEQYSKEFFIDAYETMREEGLEDVYYREYRNVPIDPTMALIRSTDLLPLTESDRLQPGAFYATADLAISKEKGRDYTVILVFRVTNDGQIQLVYIFRDRINGPEIIEEVFKVQKIFHPEIFVIEQEKITKAIGPFLEVEMSKRDIWPNIMAIVPTKDLVKRSWGIRARMRAGKFRYDENLVDWPTARSELIQFPRNKHDDIVSAFALMGLALDKVSEEPTEEEREEEEFYNARHYDDDDWQDEYDDDFLYSGADPHTGY